MRWCQVANEADLPPIYDLLANTKKGRIRATLQTAIEETLTQLRYVEDFPLTLTMATKIVDLKWSTTLLDDFTAGLHLFCLGSLEDEEIEAQRRLNSHADTLTGGDAAPALVDVATISESTRDICIPRTLAQLRYLVERSQALWHVLLGPNHPVTFQHAQYRHYLVNHERRLERVVPRDPLYRHLLPALLARALQLAINCWLQNQKDTPGPALVPSFLQIFMDIDLQRPWEPTLPAAYLALPSLPSALRSQPADISVPSGVSTAASTLSRSIVFPAAPSAAAPLPSGASTDAPTRTPTGNGTQRNMAFNESAFGIYKALNLRAKPLKESLTSRNIVTPLNSRGNRMCLTFHVMGVCNARCRYATDHTIHTAPEDQELAAWCSTNYNIPA